MLVAAAVLALGLAAPAAAWGAPVTVSEFASRIDAAASAVATADAGIATSATASSLADAVDALLPAGLDVVEGTRTIEVFDVQAVGVLTSRLRASSDGPGRRSAAQSLAAHLASMRVALGESGAFPSDPAALRAMLAARPVTTDSGQNWLDEQIAKLLKAIGDWLQKLNVPGTGASPFAPSRLLPWAVVALPLLVVAWLLLRSARRRRRKAAPVPADISGPHAPVVAAAADLPADPLRYAESLAASGMFRDAVRALYGGAARHLVDVGVVTRMRTRTSLEMLRDLSAASPGLAPVFERLTADFESAWYGHTDPGGVGFDRARESYEAVVGVPKPGGEDR